MYANIAGKGFSKVNAPEKETYCILKPILLYISNKIWTNKNLLQFYEV